MNRIARRLGAGVLAAASLAAVSFTTAPAQAQNKLACEMRGKWSDEKDEFVFQAQYNTKHNADTFDGLYFNAGAGTTALVKGVADKGTWSIVLTYTDAKHKGQIRELTGQGMRDQATNQIVVNGTFNYKQDGRPIGTGTFTLVGKCK